MILYDHTLSVLQCLLSADCLNLVTFSATLNKESFVLGRHFSPHCFVRTMSCRLDYANSSHSCSLSALRMFGLVPMHSAFIRMDAISIQEMLVHVQDKLLPFMAFKSALNRLHLQDWFLFSWMSNNNSYMNIFLSVLNIYLKRAFWSKWRGGLPFLLPTAVFPCCLMAGQPHRWSCQDNAFIARESVSTAPSFIGPSDGLG